MRDTLRFRSKVDLWILLPPWASLLAIALVDGPHRLWLGVATIAACAVFEAWLVASTRYTVTGEALVVQSLSRWTYVPLASIRSIRATRTPMAAPALSLDRLEVFYKEGSVVISPIQRAEFVRAIQARINSVDLKGVSE